ncbi:MAG: GTP-binding protein, partial [Rhodothermales bacterium]
MNVYDADHIRNVALVGHQGSGKTMLAEAMLFASGAIRRMGSIEAHSTVSDFHPSEHERLMSVFASLLHAEWKGHKINILDTPGYPDFVGEVISSLRVADTAIFVMDAVEGVQVGTELAWAYGEMIKKPSMFVINHIDKTDADFRSLVAQLKERFGHGATVVQIPAGKGSRTIIDVLLMKQLTFPEDGGEATEAEIDDEHRAEAEQLHTTLIEDIAENDEGLMELYFEKGELSEDEMRQGLHETILRRQLFPIFVTSAVENVGVSRLMSFIDNVLPSPAEMPPVEVEKGEAFTANPSGEAIALV